MASSGSFYGLIRRKEVSFVVLLVQSGLVEFGIEFSRVSRVSKIRVGIRVSARIRASLVLVIGRGYDFSTWSEWSFISRSRRVATACVIYF